jgi:signal transduction histidine kinase
MVQLKAKDLYSQRKFWRLLLMGCASVIILFSLIFTYHLARTIEKDEKNRVQEMAKAYQVLVSSSDEYEINEALKLTRNNQTIPVIWTSYDNDLLDSKNLHNKNILKDSVALNSYLKKLKKDGQVVEFTINDNEDHQLLYYDASKLLKMVRIYPYLILTLVFIFLILALVAVSFSRTAVQNQLWAGMAKETAHQLGTPLSSLSAWVDYLEAKFEGTEDEFIVDELKKDINRLEIVAERFSKIGSKPTLASTDVTQVIEKIVDYMSKRAAKSVEFKIVDKTEGDNHAMLNASLFEWVLENLIKNALDAMEGVGKICVKIDNISGVLIIDVSDSGKGIESHKIKSIFEPGFSTKKRGWGLGLTLSKRIIEEYHKGKIFVKESIIGKGTTFRIEFRKDIMN